jgi:hypothetical protein
MKKTILFLVPLICFFVIGFRQGTSNGAFFDEWESVSKDMAEKIVNNHVEEAKAILDKKKMGLKSQCKDLKKSNLSQSESERMANKVSEMLFIIERANDRRPRSGYTKIENNGASTHTEFQSPQIDAILSDFADICAD